MFGKVYNKIYYRKNWTDVFELTICSFLCLLKIILMVSNSIQFFHNLIFVVFIPSWKVLCHNLLTTFTFNLINFLSAFIPSYCTCCFVNSFIFWADISKGIGLFYTLLVLFCWLADFQSCYFARNWVARQGAASSSWHCRTERSQDLVQSYFANISKQTRQGQFLLKVQDLGSKFWIKQKFLSQIWSAHVNLFPAHWFEDQTNWKEI